MQSSSFKNLIKIYIFIKARFDLFLSNSLKLRVNCLFEKSELIAVKIDNDRIDSKTINFIMKLNLTKRKFYIQINLNFDND